MSFALNYLCDIDRLLLSALYAAGASPRGQFIKAWQVLMQTLRLDGYSDEQLEAILSEKRPLPLCIEKLDKALVNLAWTKHDGFPLIEHQGNWGNAQGSSEPCHPMFRSCRLALHSQRALIEAREHTSKMIIPREISEPILGHLIWNTFQCWWEALIVLPSGVGVSLAVYQIVPSNPIRLEGACETLIGVMDNERHLQDQIVSWARMTDVWQDYEDRFLSGYKEKYKDPAPYLFWSRVDLDADGGGELICRIRGRERIVITAYLGKEGNADDFDMSLEKSVPG